MKKKYILGVDGGSQSSKIVIFDLEGNILCEDREELKPMYLAEPGIVEHPDDDLWTSIIKAFEKTLKKFDGDVNDIIGIGLCTIRFCRALLKKDGTLAQPVMSWMDQRVSKVYEHTNPEVEYVTTSSGYITHRFTGEFVDSAANYQGVWPMDTDTWNWIEDEEKFSEFNLSRDMLFKLKMPGQVLGYVSKEASKALGIPEGIPVICTANDKATEALGAGLLNGNEMLISLGTYIAGMTNGNDNPKGTTNFWTNFACIPKKYLYESNGIRRGMWTVSWFKNLIGPEFYEKTRTTEEKREHVLEAEALLVPVGSEGLMIVPDFLAPTSHLYKKGVMLGLDARHTRGHMYRSILEAIAMTMKMRIDEMCDELNKNYDNLIITGGGSNSDLFMHIFSDVFGKKVKRNLVNGSAVIGSAICVAVGLGVYSSFEEAVSKMVKTKDEFSPNLINTKKYKEIIDKVYSQISTHTDEVLKKSYEIFK